MSPEERAKRIDQKMIEWSSKDIDNDVFHDWVMEFITFHIREAVNAEREACAASVEWFETGGPDPATVNRWGKALAAGIRRRCVA